MGHTGIVWSAGFSPDGRFVVTGSADFTARIWDPDSGTGLAEVSGHRSMVQGASFSPDGTRLLTASADVPRGSGNRPAHDRHHARRAYRRGQVRGLQSRWFPRGDRLGRQDRPDLRMPRPAGRSWCSTGTRHP